ncbi:hypothetical protein SIP08_001377 [Klebsiella aerogenes]|nr:hypothetical protein [Klebsiella aerogenes]ELW9549873.1 hypothetical protein [Klebsiella aerogenes]MBS6146096.1 hypothetical protein [Klebsiella aerogenes]MCB4375521.1 hypothetical protein [Klebsiella aerogenes]HDT6626326.1 hypothetical protein [Klebsiella aerogenes]
MLYVYTVPRCGGCVDKELREHIMIERVEMIARLTTEGACHERDREIALSLIADIAGRNLPDGHSYSVILSLDPM